MDVRHRELYWLLRRKFYLSRGNKTILYKLMFAPIWTYGIELWGSVCKSNITVIQGCQWNILRATRYITNDKIHKDRSIPAVKEVIHERRTKHCTNIESHSNQLL
jgi:hypothetical protein